MLREDTPRLSPEMAAAQEKLLAIRRALGSAPASPDLAGGRNGFRSDPARSQAISWPQHNAQVELARRRAQEGIATERPSLPTTGSPPALSLYEINDHPFDDQTADPPPSEQPDTLSSPLPTPQPPASSPRVFASHPSLLMALLRQKREAAGRVWLLLRLADSEGRGWLSTGEARAALTEHGSALRVCGWRRLRQLLAEGEGIFWTRDNDGRLWLRSAAKVAAGLGVGRLRGAPVELPVAALTGGIQQTRAHFYAAFHSGRESSPISRAALREISGVPGRTQLAYEDVARVRVRPNLAVAERYSKEGHQQRAWERGRSVFRFVDHKGTLGKPGKDYLAWRLPNSYEGPHARRSRGGQKRLNRQLGDLVQKGIPGNDENRPGANRRRSDEGQAVERVFWPNGSKAARAFNREPERDAFWPVAGGESVTRRAARERVWSVIGARRPDRFSPR